MINADKFTPVDKNLIPTGELRAVKGTPFDFTTSTKIGARIEDSYEQMVLGHGYDPASFLNRKGLGVAAARVYEPTTGRVLEVSTTQPAIQFYTGNFLDGSVTSRKGTCTSAAMDSASRHNTIRIRRTIRISRARS
jgi:aldose 1-epimerase